MATQVPPVAPTLCEVTYDLEFERHTPYRYTCWTRNSDFHGGKLPCSNNISYFDYLRSYYECRACSRAVNPRPFVSQQSNRQHANIASHHCTCPAHGSSDNRPKTAFVSQSHPNNPAQNFALPALHHDGKIVETEEVEVRPGEKLVWVDALNKWIPKHKLQRPYLSFVGTAPTVDKLYESFMAKDQDQATRNFLSEKECRKCLRHEFHMENQKLVSKCGLCGQHHDNTPRPPDHIHTQMIVRMKKKEEMRQRAGDSKNDPRRKSYSTPLYTSLKNKRNRVKFDYQEPERLSPEIPPIREDTIIMPQDSWIMNDVGNNDSMEEDVRTTSEVMDEETLAQEALRKAQEEEEKFMSLINEEYVIITEEDIKEANIDMEIAEAEERARKEEEERKAREAEEHKKQLEEAMRKIEAAKEEARLKAEEEEEREKEKQRILREAEEEAERLLEEMQRLEQERQEELDSMNQSEIMETDWEDLEEHNTEPEVVSVCENPLVKPITTQSSQSAKQQKSSDSGSPTDPKVYKGNRKSNFSVVKSSSSVGASSSKSKMKVNRSSSTTSQMGSKKIATSTSSSSHDDTDAVLTPIATVEDSHRGPLSLVVGDPESRPESRNWSPSRGKRRFSIVKKQKVIKQKEEKEEPSPTTTLPDIHTKKTGSWIFGDDDDDDNEQENTPAATEKKEESPELVSEEPPLPEIQDPETPTGDKSPKRRTLITTPVIQKLAKKLRKPTVRDTSYQDELRREELAEKRRQKQMEMLERMKSQRGHHDDDEVTQENGHNFEDYGFLAKYCIFNKGNLEMYRHTFDIVDEEGRGWLQPTETVVALRAINTKLSSEEEQYLYRILEIVGYKVRSGADFKLFSVMAALSLKISALDDWMRNIIGRMDFTMLEMKLFLCKKLWECNVDPDTNRITLDQLCVELRAGGISAEHEQEVREKLGHMKTFDILDFLTYIPLFIMIHLSVVDNPLDDSREK